MPFQGRSQVDSTYKIYENQIRDLLRSRGMEPVEIDSVLLKFSSYGLHSHEQLSVALGSLYPSNEGIAFLVYFYQNDTLQRVWIEPGRVVEIEKIAVKKRQLFDLQRQLMQGLSLNELVANRLPVQRGILIEMSSTEDSTDFDQAVKEASALLFPKNWDTTCRHLVVIPALNIGVFPFCVLKPYKDLKMLMDRSSVTICPSILDAVAVRMRIMKETYHEDEVAQMVDRKRTFDNYADYYPRSFRPRRSVLVANPLYPSDTTVFFPDLPGAEKEVKEVMKQLDGNFMLYAGLEALKSNILQSINGADIAYFATHGMADETEPMAKSCIVLSGPKPYLTAKEIMDLRLDHSFTFPKLVVLSACQSGLGKYLDAGVVGLARPFIIGGSSQVVMSLWNIDDEATAYLMTRFMHHLRLPYLNCPSEPLRQAMLETRKLFPDPKYWAGFAVFGVDY
jgi:hypothetical protein